MRGSVLLCGLLCLAEVEFEARHGQSPLGGSSYLRLRKHLTSERYDTSDKNIIDPSNIVPTTTQIRPYGIHTGITNVC